MKKKIIKKVYQLWGVNFYTGEKLRLNVYNSRPAAYRARKSKEVKDPYNYYYMVKSVTLERHKQDITKNISIEKAMKKLKDECCQFIDDNLELMCTRFEELIFDAEFEKEAMETFESHKHDFTMEISRPFNSEFIDSLSLLVKPSLQSGQYIFSFILKVNKNEYSYDYGNCWCIITCNETFASMRQNMKQLVKQDYVSRRLKESVIRKIYLKRISTT